MNKLLNELIEELVTRVLVTGEVDDDSLEELYGGVDVGVNRPKPDHSLSRDGFPSKINRYGRRSRRGRKSLNMPDLRPQPDMGGIDGPDVGRKSSRVRRMRRPRRPGVRSRVTRDIDAPLAKYATLPVSPRSVG